MREPVQHRVVDRRTQHLAKRAGPERRVVVDVAGLRAAIADHLVCQLIELEKVHADIDPYNERAQYFGDESPGRSHLLNLGACSILDHPEILPYAAIGLRRLPDEPCALSLSRAPDSRASIDSGPKQCRRTESPSDGVLVLANLGDLWPGRAARVEDVVEPLLGKPSRELETDHALAEGEDLAVVGQDGPLHAE